MRTLLIGNDYVGTPYALNGGCINDTQNLRDVLKENYGITLVDIMLDTLPVQNPRYPSRKNMIRCMEELITNLGPGEAGLLQFAGHILHAEVKGEKRALFVTADAVERSERIARVLAPPGQPAIERSETVRGGLNYENMIREDEMWELCQKLHPQATLFVVVDACHSQTAFEMPYLMTLKEVDGVTTCSLIRSEDHVARGGSVVLLSSCASNETAMETTIDGRSSGVLTFALCKVLRAHPHITYLALLKAVRQFITDHLGASHKQTPQISFSHVTDCTRAFRIGASLLPAKQNEIKTRSIEETLVCVDGYCLRRFM